ncbi:hypothetical protein [Chryseobacterium viscerum]|uniref:Uncharacterized protein n=1 Tax=Chryseobacterium viscerum TaxID=1037377 RepID=A0A5N4BP29_9FLAO|nr:hypothetical protein [Chryseobacterium viscerum]KAB1230194.1 hypothetical protein F8D52_13485 [Chryseobacterium viscerum]
MTEKQKSTIQQEIISIMNSLNTIIEATDCFPEKIQFGDPQDYLNIMNAILIKEGKEPIILPFPEKL